MLFWLSIVQAILDIFVKLIDIYQKLAGKDKQEAADPSEVRRSRSTKRKK